MFGGAYTWRGLFSEFYCIRRILGARLNGKARLVCKG